MNTISADAALAILCCICGWRPCAIYPATTDPLIKGFGRNAWPIVDGRCCNVCDDMVVLEARLLGLKGMPGWIEPAVRRAIEKRAAFQRAAMVKARAEAGIEDDGDD
jgi:hypothetical protein